MVKEARLTSKKLINFDPKMVEEIADFRFGNRIETESEALRRLITIGLQMTPLAKALVKATIDSGATSARPQLEEAVSEIERCLKLRM